MNEGEEVAVGFIVADRDVSALFDLCEQTLDVLPFPMPSVVIRSLNPVVALGEDLRFATPIVNRLKHLATITSLVSDHLFRHQQRSGLGIAVRLAGCEHKFHRVTKSIAGRMNLRAESASRLFELLIAVFFERPPHERERE